jgi:hypothetical protein
MLVEKTFFSKESSLLFSIYGVLLPNVLFNGVQFPAENIAKTFDASETNLGEFI